MTRKCRHLRVISLKPMTHSSEISAINLTPDSGACVIPSGVKFLLALVSGVEEKLLYFCARNQQEWLSLIG